MHAYTAISKRKDFLWAPVPPSPPIFGAVFRRFLSCFYCWCVFSKHLQLTRTRLHPTRLAPVKGYNLVNYLLAERITDNRIQNSYNRNSNEMEQPQTLYRVHNLTWAIPLHNMSVSLLIPVPIRLDTAIPTNICGMSADPEPQQQRLGIGVSISKEELTLIVILTPRRHGMTRITHPMSSTLQHRALPLLLHPLVRWSTTPIQTRMLPSLMSGTF